MSDCIEWKGGKTIKGYGQREHQGKRRYAHRIAYAESRGLSLDDIDGLVVRHKCDNPPCINPDHLEIGTYADNNRDMWKRGRGKAPRFSGNDHPMAKLTDSQVEEIRKRYVPRSKENGQVALAREFGVHQTNISLIVHRKKWA